ncbi:response regulator [Pseudoalteromonas sp. SSDWG2]|uniref:response regulator n=1 Tax=Pseudoalteromonas sp. SSDWG2 TaxID=3139391 RepID=UPI003BAAC9F4
MTCSIKILLVEDQDSQVEAYQDAADEISEQFSNYNIELVHETNADGAIALLQDGDFDGAIVDLNLDTSTPQEAGGNQVIDAIYNKNRFPVKVISGNLSHLGQEFVEKESPFLKFHSREDIANEEVFRQFISLYETGITKILGRKGELELRLTEVFWEHLSNDIENWASGSEKVLLRYTLNHLNEYIDRTLTTYDEREFYIKPPIKKYIATGDVVENDNGKYLVMSPACDVAPRDIVEGLPVINANRIVMCPLLPVSREQWLDKKLIQEGTGTSKLRAALEKVIKGQDPKFHFLPNHGELHASISDFQNVETCTIEEFVTYNRIATVSGEFMRDIQSRFSAYIGRQGQPDLKKSEIAGSLVSKLAPPQATS